MAIHRLKFIVGVVDYHKPVISRKDKQILHAVLITHKDTAHFVILSVVKKAEFNAKTQIQSPKSPQNANLKPKTLNSKPKKLQKP